MSRRDEIALIFFERDYSDLTEQQQAFVDLKEFDEKLEDN